MTHNIISQYNDLSSLITLYMHCDLYTGITECKRITCRFQWWPCGLRRRSAAARLLRSWVRIPSGAWMFVCCECRVLSGRGLCDELITRPEECLPTVVRRCVWSRNLKNEEAVTRVGSQRHRKNIYIYRVSQEECARLRERVLYVKVYLYNPKHLCPKLNDYGDNGQRSLKLWQLLHTCWLPNTY